MRNIWIPRFGPRLLEGLGTAEIQKYLDNLNRKTAAKYRAYLSSVMSSAIRFGQGVTYNPARFVKLSAEGPEKPYVMPTAEQVVAILDGSKDPGHKTAWQLAVWLGSRGGELRALRWESIVWEYNTILIRESVWGGKSTLPKPKKVTGRPCSRLNKCRSYESTRNRTFQMLSPAIGCFPVDGVGR
jgi:integrase